MFAQTQKVDSIHRADSLGPTVTKMAKLFRERGVFIYSVRTPYLACSVSHPRLPNNVNIYVLQFNNPTFAALRESLLFSPSFLKTAIQVIVGKMPDVSCSSNSTSSPQILETSMTD